MPDYEYECEKCRKKFTLHQTYEQHDRQRIKCPRCGGLKVKRVIGAVFAKTTHKS